MKNQRFECLLYSLFLLIMLLGCSSVTLKNRSGYTVVWDFEGEIGMEWSTIQTYDLGNNKILGLFNDRNRKYPSSAVLRLSDIPPNTPITISFDLYFIGTWDAGGKLADAWSLSIKGGDTLIDMTEFNYAYRDGKKTSPNTKTGTVDTGRRILNYWTVDHKVTIPPEKIKGNSLALSFNGYLTGQGTEFWALDNVKVTVGSHE